MRDDQKRKWVYWSTFVVSAVLLWSLFGATVAVPGVPVWITVVLFYSAPLLPGFLARRACERRGLSLAADTVETIQGAVRPASRARQWRVVVGTPRRWLAVGAAATGSIATAILWFGLRAASMPDQGTTVLWVASPFVLFTALLMWGYLTDARILAEASGKGVTSKSLFPGSTKRVPWSDIGRSEVRIQRSTVGTPTSTTCIFYDHGGCEMLRFNLNGVSGEERERFLEAVRDHEGQGTRAELMAAAAPPGVGTELLSGEAPEGRGTEMESAPAGQDVARRERAR